jgi:hypothetical protein
MAGTGVALGPVHAPVFCGEPVRCVKRSKGALLLHTVCEPLPPALGRALTVTVTVAEATMHGGVPVTV